MKTWMLALSFVVVLGFTGLANAKNTQEGHGIKGKIVSINGNSFTMTIGGKNSANAGTTVTVDTTGATVTGTLAPGAKVSVVGGTLAANKITGATSIKVGHGHKKKPTT